MKIATFPLDHPCSHVWLDANELPIPMSPDGAVKQFVILKGVKGCCSENGVRSSGVDDDRVESIKVKSVGHRVWKHSSTGIAKLRGRAIAHICLGHSALKNQTAGQFTRVAGTATPLRRNVES